MKGGRDRQYFEVKEGGPGDVIDVLVKPTLVVKNDIKDDNNI